MHTVYIILFTLTRNEINTLRAETYLYCPPEVIKVVFFVVRSVWDLHNVKKVRIIICMSLAFADPTRVEIRKKKLVCVCWVTSTCKACINSSPEITLTDTTPLLFLWCDSLGAPSTGTLQIFIHISTASLVIEHINLWPLFPSVVTLCERDFWFVCLPDNSLVAPPTFVSVPRYR